MYFIWSFCAFKEKINITQSFPFKWCPLLGKVRLVNCDCKAYPRDVISYQSLAKNKFTNGWTDGRTDASFLVTFVYTFQSDSSHPAFCIVSCLQATKFGGAFLLPNIFQKMDGFLSGMYVYPTATKII